MDDSPTIFYYSPQNLSYKDTSIIIKPGDALTLDFEVGGSQNKYVWYRNDVKIDSTGHTLSIESADETTSGIYYCEVTNELAPKLTIRSGNFDVFVKFPVNTTDSLALVALYNQCGGENWKNKENWLTGPLDTWENVTVENGRVTELNLKNNNLSGEWCSDLFNLSELRILDLSSNDITDSLPADIEKLTKLNTLKLNSNNLTGTLPPEIGNLKNLNYLGLSYNDFSGEIPSAIGNLKELKSLYFNNNNFTGTIPETIGSLTNLEYLDLSFNSLSGTIPESINNLLSLKYLYLTFNNFSGIFPDISNLTQLRYLYLYNNELTDIPYLKGSLSSLSGLYIQNNYLSFGDLEPLMDDAPSFFNYSPQKLSVEDTSIIVNAGEPLTLDFIVDGTQNKYVWYRNDVKIDSTDHTLTIEKADTITLGTYYCEVTNELVPKLTLRSGDFNVNVRFPVNTTDSLALVALYNQCGGENWKNKENWLTGPLDTWENVKVEYGRVTELHLNNNNLSGEWCSDLFNLSELRILDLSSNDITDSLPADIEKLTKLNTLKLNSNNLTGTLPPEIGNLKNLNYLGLSYNDFSGEIPSAIGNLKELKSLYFNNNNFTGTIPETIGSLTNLEYLDLSFNSLSGTIPESINNLLSLKYLYLTFNNFSGIFPDISNLTQLRYLYLYNNELTDIPYLKGSLSSLISLYIQNNYLSFGDLEPLMDDAPSFFNYSPQKLSVEDTSIIVNAGEPLTLDFIVDGTQNKYVWYRNDVKIDSTDHTLTIEKADTITLGTYYCEVTNELAPKLTIRSGNFDVFVKFPVNTTDSLALVALYNQCGGENWKNKENWLTGPLDTWENVKVEYGRVTELHLNNNNLSGEWCSDLFNLSELRILDLSSNDITDSLPADIEKLTKLNTLKLNSNNLSGTLPPEIGNLKNLNYLDLSKNDFSGEIPSAIGNLKELKSLYFNNNNFTGTIPETIGSLTNLEYLDLSFNSLSGTIPESINNLLSLKYLYLTFNNFSGIFPDISNLTQLRYLYLYNNELTDIPYLKGSLSSLISLYIQNNYLAVGDLEPLMDDTPTIFIYSPQKLSVEDTSIIVNAGEPLTLDFIVDGTQNKYVWYRNDVKIDSTDHTLTIEKADTITLGTYYCEVTNELVPKLTLRSGDFNVNVRFPVNTTDSLALVALYNQCGGENWKNKENWLTGPLDTWENVKVEYGRVTELHLNNNNLSGEWCSDLFNLSELRILDLSSNDITDSLPADIEKLTKLNTLKLNSNNLSGTLPPEIGNLKNLNYLDLSKNDFSGEIPSAIGNLKELKSLYFNNNNFTGTIPETIGSLTNLEYLDLSFNSLSGTIPESINNLLSLKYLSLTYNNFSGIFPDISNLTQLRYLFLYNNELTDIPYLKGSLSSLISLYIQNNYLSFGDLEPLMDDTPTIFIYSPQKLSVEDTSIIVGPGDTVTLDFMVDGSQNKYVWYREDVKIDSTGHTLTIEDADTTTSALYYCEVTNELVPKLTFRSGNFNVFVRFPVNTTDSLALVALYNQNGGESWHSKTNWLSGSVDTWENVTVFNGRVTGLNMPSNNLTGQWCSDLSNLSELRVLNLLSNNLSGNIPDNISNLKKLETLDLRNNKLSGDFPIGITNITNLKSLDLSGNKFSGEIPSDIEKLTELETLELSRNDFSGTIPSGINNLISIKTLDLSDNQLEGSLPDIDNLTEIRYLYIDNNYFSDISSLLNFPLSLFYLNLRNNYLDFEDLEPLMEKEISILYYSPQKGIETEDSTVVLTAGEKLELEFTVGGSQNQYTWYKDGNIFSENNNSLTIEDVQESDAGTYYCEVTNNLVPDLTIRSRKYIVTVSPETYVPSIEEYGIRIAPNPSTGRFTLYNIQEIRDIAIFNIKGERIFFTENNAASEQITINLNNKGLFVLQLKTKKGEILTEKIVIR
ncbi:leucine-rich repeat domain-containing protein [Thermophagus xiamenensis]|uniref:leucine-rich repeat domain-containing protein n=1 Tax=Thermophagus xiamenensis TaxID=385682 RepID=UPI000300EE0F|nr:leucine-rich repeat domain-containing protein [Thermophagus xiamenensis]